MKNVLPPITPGWKSSEFILVVVASLVAILNKALGWHIDASAAQNIALMIVGYAVSRGLTKHGKTETVNVATTGDVTTGSGE